MYTVYALIDPRDYMIRYVGMTVNLEKRLSAHLSAGPFSESANKRCWIQALKEENQRPIVEVLEEVEEKSNAKKREIYWIYYCLDAGCPLLNRHYKGGRQSHEEKAKASLLKAIKVLSGLSSLKYNDELLT